MPKTKLTINSKTLFPVEHLKEHIKEALRIARDLSPAIITQNNRPAYAIVRIDDDPEADDSELRAHFAEQIIRARESAKGAITTEPYRWEKL